MYAVLSTILGELTFLSFKAPCRVPCGCVGVGWRMSVGHVLDSFVTDDTKGRRRDAKSLRRLIEEV